MDPLKDFITRKDLKFAVGMCALPYGSSRAVLDGNLSRLAKLRLEITLWRWARRIKDFKLPEECEAFNSYLSFHRRFPSIKPWGGDKSFRTLNSPEECRLVEFLMETYCHGLDIEAAMLAALSTPILRAYMLWAINAERNGLIELTPDFSGDPHQRSFWNWAKEQDENFGNN